MAKRKQKRPRLVVYLRKMTADTESHSYALRGVPVDKYDEVLNALTEMEVHDELMDVRLEDGEIIFGASEQDDIFSFDCEDVRDGFGGGLFCSFPCSAGKLTEKVQEMVESILGRRIRAHFVEEAKCTGELIWGESWRDDVALTEDERSAFGY